MARAVPDRTASPSATDDLFAGLEPAEIWRHFAVLNSIPRPSGEEDSVRRYVQSVAEECGATWEADKVGNMVVRIPAIGLAEEAQAPTVAVQTHLDMVCDADPDVDFDCWTDPIRPRREGDGIYANGTTLGADNGIGVAAALSLLTSRNLRHGPLELLFTVEEERGLRGAIGLDPTLIRADLLINLDSEDSGRLIVGCAGANDMMLRLHLAREPLDQEQLVGRSLVISGLRGGHSGLDIDHNRANAVKLLARAWDRLAGDSRPLWLTAVDGGTARNAIPRWAEANFALPADDVRGLERAIADLVEELRTEWGSDEPDLDVQLAASSLPGTALTLDCANALMRLIGALPHGVLSRSEGGAVMTSCNLALVKATDSAAELLLSSRSFDDEELTRVESELNGVAVRFGADASITSRYPPWTPESRSGLLLRLATDVARHVYSRNPRVESIHAGLECGVIVAKVDGLEAISFGPSIVSSHTPREHVVVSTVLPMWLLLTELLERLATSVY